MLRNKYNLSQKQAEKLFYQTIQDMAEGVYSDEEEKEEPFYVEGEVTLPFLRTVTGVESVEEARKLGKQGDLKHMSIINLYGFETLYDLFLYAESCTYEPIHKSKDYSKLVPVKQKVIRGGKEQEVTVYRKPDGSDEQEDGEGEKGAGGGGAQKRPHAKEMKKSVFSKDEKADLSKIVELKKKVDESGGGEHFNESADYLLVLYGEDGEPVGVSGYNKEGSYLHMEFVQRTEEVDGVATRAFFEGLRLAMQLGEGFQVDDVEPARPLFSQYGLQQKGKKWEITYKEIQSHFGENHAR